MATRELSKPGGASLLLVLPALLLLVALLFVPLGQLALESLREFVPWRVGGQADRPLTLANYVELLDPAYGFYFVDTLRIGLVVCVCALILGYPLAALVARHPDPKVRKTVLGLLIGMLFLSLVARLYAILMAFGTQGPLHGVVRFLAFGGSRAAATEVEVILGLLHFVLPVVALMMIGALQNVNPRLGDAAQTLGAPRWRATLEIVFPLAVPGFLSAFLVGYAMCISNFVVPLILGRGIVLFVSSLMYIRFSEVANFPSGAAIGLVMLVLSFALVYGLTALVRRLFPTVRT